MEIFFETLTPMITLFLCIAIGFAVQRSGILPDTAGKTLAKLETWVFCPALNFITMVRYCTVDSISTHATNVAMASVSVVAAVGIAIFLGRFFVRERCAERGVYMYALAFANCGYMGDPIVLGMFGEEVLAYYKLFCLPLCLMIYTWGISVLTPSDGKKGAALMRMINPPTVAMLAGIAVGLSGLGGYMPVAVSSALDSLKGCMGPVAMLLAGMIIARYDVVAMLKNKRVYIATALRLTLLPALIIALLFGVKELWGLATGSVIGNDALFLCLFATATPLGLNTIVFPEAYGGDPGTGASMTMISHTLSVISIPLVYALAVAVLGVPFTAIG